MPTSSVVLEHEEEEEDEEDEPCANARGSGAMWAFPLLHTARYHEVLFCSPFKKLN